VRLATLLIAPALLLAGQAAHAGGVNRIGELRRLEAQERQIRGLSQLRPVQAQFLANAPFRALIRKQMKRDEPASETDLSQREMDVIGFLQPGQNLRAITINQLSSLPIGVYDDRTRTLYVRNQGNQAFKLERYAIVHEYTHALQDQHWNLRAVLPDETKIRYRNSDALTAHQALVEGDATNTQGIYLNRFYSQAEIRAMMSYESKLPQPKLPWAIQIQFYFPYTNGLQFVQTLYSRGGMAAVNRAFRRLPSSSYEILFPNAYLSRWHPEAVALHSVRGFAGWKQTDDDVFGAVGYDMLLAQHGGSAAARTVVQSYRGDRYIFLERGRKSLMLMVSRWTSRDSAKAAAAALARSLDLRFGSRASWNTTHTTVSVPGLSVSVSARGRSVAMAYAPSPGLSSKLGAASTT
jgi:hypothetical protein